MMVRLLIADVILHTFDEQLTDGPRLLAQKKDSPLIGCLVLVTLRFKFSVNKAMKHLVYCSVVQSFKILTFHSTQTTWHRGAPVGTLGVTLSTCFQILRKQRRNQKKPPGGVAFLFCFT